MANYKDDIKEGHLLRWHTNGALKDDCWYKNDELDSVYRSYSENGALAFEGYYVDGKLNGAIQRIDLETCIIRKTVDVIVVIDILCFLKGILFERLTCFRDIYVAADILKGQYFNRLSDQDAGI